MPKRIILSGSIAIDHLMTYEGDFSSHISVVNVQALSLSLLFEKHEVRLGGVAANIAYSLALLGDSPIVYGSIGRDGVELISVLKQFGACTEYVHFSTQPTATAVILTDSKHNQITGFHPGAMLDATKLDFREFIADKEKVFMVSAHDPTQMLQQTESCRQNHSTFFFDPGQQTAFFSGEQLYYGMKGAQILFANEYELAMICQKCKTNLEKIVNDIPIVVITYGEMGSKVFCEGKVNDVPIIPISKVIDPTGAGDAYRAGFLFGWVRGWEVQQCAQLGATIASFAIVHAGGQSHKFTLPDVVQRYTENFGSVLGDFT